MDHADHPLQQQYRAVVGSREVLLAYCGTLEPTDLLRQHPSFGQGGSIRNLLVHVVNTYEFWVMNIGLGVGVDYTASASVETVDEIAALYAPVDEHVGALLRDPDALYREVPYALAGRRGTTRPFEIFTHVITHEFHHKGQVLSLSRAHGYTPVDTDVIR